MQSCSRAAKEKGNRHNRDQGEEECRYDIMRYAIASEENPAEKLRLEQLGPALDHVA